MQIELAILNALLVAVLFSLHFLVAPTVVLPLELHLQSYIGIQRARNNAGGLGIRSHLFKFSVIEAGDVRMQFQMNGGDGPVALHLLKSKIRTGTQSLRRNAFAAQF